MSPLTRASAGQASVEWLGLVALVATLFGLGAAMAQAGFVGRHVTREMARALCRVRGGDCERDHEPCATSSAGSRHSLTLDLAIVRLGGGDVAVLEQRSDGTVAVTRGTTELLGVTAGLGISRGLMLAGIDVEAAAGISASYVGSGEQARTWIVGSRAAADRLVAELRTHPVRPGRRGPAAPVPRVTTPPDIVYHQLGTEATLDARLGATAADDEVTIAGAGMSFSRLAGTRTDARTGHRTVYVQSSSHTSLTVGGVLGLAHDGGGERYEVEFDAHGRPLDLRVISHGRYDGSADLPGVVQPVAGMLAAGPAEGRVYSVEAHLDLTDPDNLAAARGLMDAMRPHFGDPAAAAQALRRRLDEHGSIEARVLTQDVDDASHGLKSPVGPDIGASWAHESRTTRLLAATSRGLDGQWIPRTDCVA